MKKSRSVHSYGALARRSLAVGAVLALTLTASPGRALALEDTSSREAAQVNTLLSPRLGNAEYYAPAMASNASDFAHLAAAVKTPDSLFNPGGIAIDKNGNVYVVAAGNDRIDIYADNGSFLESWGDSGTGPGEFSFHNSDEGWSYGDIAIDNDGNFFVADPGNHRIQMFDSEKKFVDSIDAWDRPAARNGEYGAEWHQTPAGAVRNEEYGTEWHQTPAGAVNTGGYGADWYLTPAGLAIDEASDRLYVADAGSNTVKVYKQDGTFLNEWGATGPASESLVSVFDVAVGPDGSVYVPDFATSRIYQLSVDGDLLRILGGHGTGQGQLMGAGGVAVDKSGNLYVSDYLQGQIMVITPDGTIAGLIAADLGLPTYVAVSPLGSVWVSFEETNTIARFVTMDPAPGMSFLQ